jgi:hypothetical protein
MSTHPHQMSPTKTCFREAGGKSTLLKGGRITHNASYGACMAAQRHRDALIRGDLGMARIWPLTLAEPCLAKSVGPDSYSESQPQLCCAACRVTCHHPRNRFRFSFQTPCGNEPISRSAAIGKTCFMQTFCRPHSTWAEAPILAPML